MKPTILIQGDGYLVLHFDEHDIEGEQLYNIPINYKEESKVGLLTIPIKTRKFLLFLAVSHYRYLCYS